MTAFPWTIGPHDTTRSCVGFFLKLLQAPSAPMTLLDISAGAQGYWRFLLSPTLSISLEVSLAYAGGNTYSATVQQAGLALGTWAWISGDGGNGGQVNLALTQAGGSIVADRGTAPLGVPTETTYAVSVGWGTPLSNAALPFWSDPAKGEMSKLWVSHGGSVGPNTTALPMPSVDPPLSGGQDVVALYLCHDTPLGSIGALHDETGTYDLAAVGTLVVNADGPFIS